VDIWRYVENSRSAPHRLVLRAFVSHVLNQARLEGGREGERERERKRERGEGKRAMSTWIGAGAERQRG
jgi:hypothetical protein